MDLIWKLLHLSLQLQRFLKQIPLKFKISSKLQDNNQFGLRNDCQPEGMPMWKECQFVNQSRVNLKNWIWRIFTFDKKYYPLRLSPV